MRGYREIELSVIEHLSPDVAVHYAADVLQELPVNVFRDRSAGLRNVNGRVNWLRLSGTESGEK
jgi:hypothetical protein